MRVLALAGSCGSRRRSVRARRRIPHRSAPAMRPCGRAVNGTVDVDDRRSSPPARRRRTRPERSDRQARPSCRPTASSLNVLLDALKRLRAPSASCGRLVDLPVLLRRKTDARPVGAAALVGAAEGRRPTPRRSRPAGRCDRPEARILRLEGGDVLRRRSAHDRRPESGSCQISVFCGTSRAEVARARAHVAMRQLEPGAGERVSELIGILVEAPRDLFVGRVEAQGEGPSSAWSARGASTGREHREPCRAGTVFRLPLLRTGGALRSAPIRSSNRFSKKSLLHFVGVVGPGDFRGRW